MLLVALLVSPLGLASGVSLVPPVHAPTRVQDEGEVAQAPGSLVGDVLTETHGLSQGELVTLQQYAWSFSLSIGSSSSSYGRSMSAVTGLALPDGAQPLELGVVHVPPFDIAAWDFGPKGLPEFIVRNPDQRIEWVQTGRDLTPRVARVIPGIGRGYPRRHGLGDVLRKEPVYLGASRWLLNHGGWPENSLVVFDGKTGATERLDLTWWLGEEARPILGTALGDGKGGAVFEVLGPDREVAAILTMGAEGQLVDEQASPREALTPTPQPTDSGALRSDGAHWRVAGGEWRAKGGEWRPEASELQRLDAEGNVVERLRSPLGPVYSEVTSRKPWLLDDGRIVALEPGLPALHVRNPDGSESRWARQGLATWVSAAVDGDGALWITGREHGGGGELRNRGWSKEGAPLGTHFAKGGLGFDAQTGHVWSAVRDADASGGERLVVRLQDANGNGLAEHRLDAPGGWTPIGAVAPDWFVDQAGRAWLWVRFEEGSALWRFGPEGALDAELQLAGYAVQGTELGVAQVPADPAPLDMRYRVGNELLEDAVPQRGPFAFGLRTEGTLLSETRRWVVLDLADLDAVRFRYLGYGVAEHARTVHFAGDGSSIMSLLDQPALYTERAMEEFIWIPVDWPGHFGR